MQLKDNLLVLLPPPLLSSSIYHNLKQILTDVCTIQTIDYPKSDNFGEILNHFRKNLTFISKRSKNIHIVAPSATSWILFHIISDIPLPRSIILFNAFTDNSEFKSKYTLPLKATRLVPQRKFKNKLNQLMTYISPELNSEHHRYFKNSIENHSKKYIRNLISNFLNRNNPKIHSMDTSILFFRVSNDPLIPHRLTRKTQKILEESSKSLSVNNLKITSHFPYLVFPELVGRQVHKFILNLE